MPDIGRRYHYHHFQPWEVAMIYTLRAKLFYALLFGGSFVGVLLILADGR